MGEDRQGRENEHSSVSRDESPSYDADIRNAIRFERVLAVKSLVPFGLVALVIAAYLTSHG